MEYLHHPGSSRKEHITGASFGITQLVPRGVSGAVEKLAVFQPLRGSDSNHGFTGPRTPSTR